MKRNWILLFCLAGSLGGCGLFDKKKDAGAEANSHDVAVYHQAMKVGDFNTAIAAVHSILAETPDNTSYYDTLSILYFRNSQFPQAALSAQELLVREPRNEKMLNIAARSFEMLEMQDSALKYFTQLHAIDQSPEYQYQIAMTQFKLNDIPSSKESAQKVVGDKRADTMQMLISTNETGEQVVPLKAAAFNLLGTISHTEKKDDEARGFYKMALTLYPDFIIVQNNLKRLEGGKL
jgi:tetratricopeptide (TPR) repeat protein